MNEQAGLCWTWSELLIVGFSHSVAHMQNVPFFFFKSKTKLNFSFYVSVFPFEIMSGE